MGNILTSIAGSLSGLLGIAFSLLLGVASLAAFVPSLAVAVRRMHDNGKSDWYILIPIYSFVLAVSDSTPGDNQYGPNPKGIGSGLPPMGYGMPPA